MKKILFVLFSLSAVSFILFHAVNAKGQSESDLLKMVSVLQRENIFINEWSLYARKKLETSGEEQETALMKQFPELSWKISQGENQWEATAIFSKRKDVNESIKILSTDTESYLIYEVKGAGWGKGAKEYLQGPVESTINDIFRGKVTIFSCINSELDGKLDESLSANVNDLLTAFDAHEIEKLEETSFVSASAYSPLFSESIKGTSGAINLQVGVREEGLGGKTTLVVGTPIITIEY